MTPPPQRKPYQFGTRALFGVTVMLSMLAAIAGNLFRRGDDQDRHYDTFIFVVLAVGSPLLVLMIASIYYQLTRPAKRKRK